MITGAFPISTIGSSAKLPVAAAQPECGRLETPLQLDPRQGMIRAELLGCKRDDQPAVGKRRIVARAAHPVGAKALGLRHAGDHGPPGAHAEGVEIALPASHDRIVGRPQQLDVFAAPVLLPVDGGVFWTGAMNV